MSDEKLCGAAAEASEPEHNIEDCKTQKHGGTYLSVLEVTLPCMQISRRCLPANYHHVTWIMKKIAIFFTISQKF